MLLYYIPVILKPLALLSTEVTDNLILLAEDIGIVVKEQIMSDQPTPAVVPAETAAPAPETKPEETKPSEEKVA